MDGERGGPLQETITLQKAKKLIQCMAHEQSFLLLSPPGVGKSDIVYQAAHEAGLPCRSLLGTQIAPEDVSGIPRIVGERSVFCPPRMLLPESAEPFCLFLDELPACAPDVQKSFYSLLLERRLGEHSLPTGTWVVAAGNRMQDRALVRSMSSALVNRVTILHVRVCVDEWQAWAQRNGVRADVRTFIYYHPDALARDVPQEPVPFSTPRAWAALSRALDLAEGAGVLSRETRRALAFGRLSPEDAGRKREIRRGDRARDASQGQRYAVAFPRMGRRGRHLAATLSRERNRAGRGRGRRRPCRRARARVVSGRCGEPASRGGTDEGAGGEGAVTRRGDDAMRGARGSLAGNARLGVAALRGLYRTPWQLALQRWMESVAPGERTFTRPSRRAAPQADVVLPGRRREGWLLNVVLDTSASMTDEIGKALGAIADFCDTAGVDQVRLVQCDAGVTADDFLAPDALAEREIAGFGGSDLSPALLHLAGDPRTRAAIVVTDGDIAYPQEPMPYDVLWVLPASDRTAFDPPYGRVVTMA